MSVSAGACCTAAHSVPAVHCMHVVEACVTACVPGAHATHVVLPEAAAYLPCGQATHVFHLSCENVPGAHGRHSPSALYCPAAQQRGRTVISSALLAAEYAAHSFPVFSLFSTKLLATLQI